MLLVSIIPTIKAIAKNGIIAPNQTCELLPSTYFSRIREAIETTIKIIPNIITPPRRHQSQNQNPKTNLLWFCQSKIFLFKNRLYFFVKKYPLHFRRKYF
uniref:Uncharacterized protein n=1 Tax=Limosilactobacillus reuteri 1063 TaxID=1273150 RepID=A0A0S3WHA4_LIMR5|nr:hypothetical protein [Limosilactobacillus reuteri 1063]